MTKRERLAQLLREAEEQHQEYEAKRLAIAQDDGPEVLQPLVLWPEFYAAYLLRNGVRVESRSEYSMVA